MSNAMYFTLTYVLNALWQASLVLVAAWVTARVVRRVGVLAEHRVWTLALFLQIVLPACSLSPGAVSSMAAGLLRLFAGEHGDARVGVTVAVRANALHAVPPMPHSLLLSLAILNAAVCAYLAARLVWRLLAVRKLLREAHAIQAPTALLVQWQAICARFNIAPAQLLLSDGPVGLSTVCLAKHVVVLSKDLVQRSSQEELRAGFAHECAHIVRSDFRKGLLLEVLALPLAFHPALWLAKKYWQETREMVCDSMAADVVEGRTQYARSLLRLAVHVASAPALLHHAVGLFDANTLERRITMLQTKSTVVSTTRRILTAAACLTIGSAVTASALTWRQEVQLPAQPAASAPTPGAPVHVASQEFAETIESRVDPVYPPIAKAAKVSGAVVLKAIIGKDGTMQRLVVLSGPPMLQGATLDAVRQWTYKPYLLNGEPVEVETTITVNYTLPKK